MAKKYLFGAVIIVALVGGGFYLTRPSNAPQGQLDDFAKCLASKGITMYGAEWCAHCQNEKKAFGDSFRFVQYIECPKHPARCIDAGVNGYPTWTFPGGKKLEGEQGLEKLAAESGCALPSASDNSGAQNSPAAALRRGELKTDAGEGNVTVDAEFVEEGGEFVFTININTHSVDLSMFYNPETQSELSETQITLQDSGGGMIQPVAIRQEGDGHHLKFTMHFPKIDGPIKLVISNLAGVPTREILWP